MKTKRTIAIGAGAILTVLVCGAAALAMSRANALGAKENLASNPVPNSVGPTVLVMPSVEEYRWRQRNSAFQDGPVFGGTDEAAQERNRRFAEEIAPAAEHNKTAERLLKEGDLEGAEREARLAVDKGPRLKNGERFGPFLQKLGDVRLAQGRYEEALALYARARQSTGGDDLETNALICRAELGRITIAEGKSAAQKLSRIIGREGEDIGAPKNAKEATGFVMGLRGSQLFFEVNVELSMYWLDRSAENLPHHAPLALMRARVAIEQKDWDKAIRCYETAIRYGEKGTRIVAEREIYVPKHKAGLLPE